MILGNILCIQKIQFFICINNLMLIGVGVTRSLAPGVRFDRKPNKYSSLWYLNYCFYLNAYFGNDHKLRANFFEIFA